MAYFTGVRNRAEARVRHRELCRQYHPDRLNTIMQEINAEYDQVKRMSDAELAERAARLARAVSHLPKLERDESFPAPAKPAQKGYVYIPSQQTLAAIAEQQRLMNLPAPSYYTLEQRQAYARAQEEGARRARNIDLDNARRFEQDEIERQQAEARAAVARTMRGRG